MHIWSHFFSLCKSKLQAWEKSLKNAYDFSLLKSIKFAWVKPKLIYELSSEKKTPIFLYERDYRVEFECLLKIQLRREWFSYEGSD